MGSVAGGVPWRARGKRRARWDAAYVTITRRKQLRVCGLPRRLHRGVAAAMPVTGKTFRRRRADSESEEDEQDSEEVRWVSDGLSQAG